MAVRKKRETQKTKKEIVKKQKPNMVVEKKAAEEKKPELPEIQRDVPKQEQTPVSESVAPTVIPSGVLPDTSKEETTQPDTVASQPLQQAADALTSEPPSATSNLPNVEPTANKTESLGVVTQNPLAVEDDSKDKPEEHIEEPKKKKQWIVIVVIVVGVIFIAGALWYFRENAIKQVSLKDKITSTPSPSRVSPTPASDSAKLIDYSKYKIKVLNGSGIKGAAAKGKEILESEKFVVDEIGNAETSDYEKTVIQSKKEVPSAFLDKLKSVLEESYLLGSNEKLEESEEVDVVIIIGSGKQP